MEFLVRDFFAKTPAGSNRPPLDYNWPLYYQLEAAGIYVVYTAREAGKLVGFSMYTMAFHPHHQTVRYAYCELIGVLHSERRRGIGNKLIAYAETELPKLGVDRMIQGDRYYHGKTSIFEKRPGYTLVERFYQKVLMPEPAEGDAAASPPQPPVQSET